MNYEAIKKSNMNAWSIKPNLRDYNEAKDNFKWQDIAQELNWFEDGRINIAHEALDRHITTSLKDKVALYWEGKKGEKEQYTFHQLSRLTNRFANVLKNLGVEKGDRVFTYMDRIPEIYICLLGALKVGGVIGPLFSAFGPDAVRDRLADSEAKVLITSPRLVKTAHEIVDELPALETVIIVNKRAAPYELKDKEVSYESLMKKSSAEFEIEKTDKEDYAIIHYTSGTTGKPKGVVHVHEAILGHYATAKYVLDLQPDDIYWCTADPGWVTGTSYGIFGPWSNGISQVVYEGGFGASLWYGIIEKYKVTVWYTAPTAIRMLMKAGEKPVNKHDLSRLRYMCSVGEPLNPEAVLWGTKVLGLPFHDNWWQTETGCIQIANYPVQDIKPGEWYITGDRASRDEEGYFWFVGRADDVINTAGHLVGPFEVESALIEHPAVAEAGVIGIPDPIAMEVIKAFVSLKDGYEPSKKLMLDIRKFARKKLHALACPREIEFIAGLPKTRSGKIMRRLLKARELGLPEGDTSTLED
jgi:acetyl-CoA synthetase